MPATPGQNRTSNHAASLRSRRVLVVDADSALLALLEQWLVGDGFEVIHEGAVGERGRIDVAIVDVPQPRQGGAQRIGHIAARHPNIPILALSSAFFPGIERSGSAALALGASAVLAKPMSREALSREVHRLLTDG